MRPSVTGSPLLPCRSHLSSRTYRAGDQTVWVPNASLSFFFISWNAWSTSGVHAKVVFFRSILVTGQQQLGMKLKNHPHSWKKLHNSFMSARGGASKIGRMWDCRGATYILLRHMVTAVLCFWFREHKFFHVYCHICFAQPFHYESEPIIIFALWPTCTHDVIQVMLNLECWQGACPITFVSLLLLRPVRKEPSWTSIARHG